MAVMSIGRALARLVDQDPERPAITHEGRTVTRRQLEQRTNRLARAYAEMGVRTDTMVTIALPNGIEFYEAALAAWKLGATPQPVSARLPYLERQAIVELADPALIAGVEAGTHGPRPTVPAGFEPDPSHDDSPLEEHVAQYWKAPTSGGSTGRPKLIVAAEAGVVDPEVPALSMNPNGVQLVPGPLYHNGPFSFSTRGLLMGHHLTVLTRFDAARALAEIERHRVTWVLMVPTMMQRIWRLPEDERTRYDLSSLETVLHLGAPCPVWLKEAWIDWLGPDRIHELYAGTEAQGVTWITGKEWLDHKGSVGRPISGSQMRILDESGDELPAGQVGEVWMLPPGGPGSTYHYIGAQARAIGEWESLGDMGWMDTDGYLYLADRGADLILSGGANVYPAEVEAAIDAHRLVRSSAVIGLPHDDLGETVHAIVDVADHQGLDADALRGHLSDRLVGYKIPRSFEFVREPLRDDAGKVRRSALRADRLAPN
jgi:bile acid-coenzyme A ligase